MQSERDFQNLAPQADETCPHPGMSRRELIRTGLFTVASLSLVDLQSARPAHAQASECHFAIIGDYGWSGTAERDVANLVKSWSPEFIVTTGDNNYGDTVYETASVETIDKNIGQYYHEFIHPYLGSYGTGAETNRFFPALADKDWNAAIGYQAYLDYFTLPHNERYYDFTWGPVHFFMVNSELHDPDGSRHPSVQSAWLQSRLAASTAPWKIVVLHHPPYATRGGFVRLQWPFKEWGADVVLSGQHHVYERLLVDGLTYVINGLGGRSRGDFVGLDPAEGSLVRYGADYGAQRVTAASDRITFEFFTRAGELIDSFTLWKEAALPAPANLEAAPAAPASGYFRGINLNGPAVTIEGRQWLSHADALGQGLSVTGADSWSGSYTFELSPTADADTRTMLESCIWKPGAFQVRQALANGEYDVCLWMIENWRPNYRSMTATGEGATLASGIGTLPLGSWRKYGPFRVSVQDGALDLQIARIYGDAVLFGLSIESANGGSPETSTAIRLSWTDRADGEEGVEIERSADGTRFSVVGLAGPNSTGFTDDPEVEGATFFYRVRAFVGDRYSDYSNVAQVTTPGTPANENLLAYSEQLDRWAVQNACAVTANAGADPNGGVTADRLDDSLSTTGFPAVYTDVMVPESGPYVFSCYLQAVSLSLATVRIDNLNTKVRLVEAPFTLSGSWQRFSAVLADVPAGHKLRIFLYPGQYKRDGGSILAWGAQLERGSVPGPYRKKPA
ncbi:MAG: metallophosphoesterase [Armatimonadota bacterium]